MSDGDEPKDGVSVEAISSTPIPEPIADNAAHNEETQFAHEREKLRRELGWIGLPFGGRNEKPGNISAFTLLIVFIFLFVGFFFIKSTDNSVRV